MKIWQVVESDNQIRFYWFATKQEADKHANKYRKEMIEDGKDTFSATVEPISYPATRAGLAAAMNYVITMTCFNEG